MTTAHATQEPTVTVPTGLTLGDTFTHSVPKGWTRYQFTLVRFEGTYGTETIGLLVADADGSNPEAHDLCKRCGEGFGHFSWNGEDDICYECQGEGYGKPASLEDQLRRAVNRKKVAERRERQAREAAEKATAELVEWVMTHKPLSDALQSFLPKMETDEYNGGTYRHPATTFLAKLAVQLHDDHKPLTERQTAAAEEAISKAQARNEERVAAGHWGTVGKRDKVVVTVLSAKDFEGDYGTRWLISMRSAEGHSIKTWATGAFVSDALDALDAEDKTLTVKATVKAHGSYNGLPETTVTRVAALG